MEISKSTFVAVQLLLGVIIIAVVVTVSYLVLRVDVDVSDAEIEAQITRLTASARLYFSRVQFYDGVCADIGVPEGFTCTESVDSYAIEARLKSGQFFCADSRGFFGAQVVSKGKMASCHYYPD